MRPFAAFNQWQWGARDTPLCTRPIGELVLASDQHNVQSDAQLLARSRDGDSAAFGALWERHRLAGIVAARSIAPTLDPDDLVSGAYLKILELVLDGRGPTGAFRPYLYRVISSLAVDTYRSPELSNSELEDIPDLTEAGPWEDGAFDLNAAARAFESLPERWQSVLWYTEVEGLAPRQIAPMLGLSANGVSALAVRAKEGLQSAWVETHTNMQLADDLCRTTREQLQRYQRNKLTSKRSREIAAHLEECSACAAAASESMILNKQLALVLATIVIGGGASAVLLESLGAGAGIATLGSAGAGAGNASSSATSGAAAGGASGGVGVGIIAAATTLVLVAAAAGGVILVNALGDTGAPTTQSEPAGPSDTDSPSADAEDDAERTLQKPGSDQLDHSLPLDDQAEATRARSETAGPGTRPAGPKEPPPVIPPITPPLHVGYECYVPHLDSRSFELTGRASRPGTVDIGVNTSGGTYLVQVTAGPDGSWTSGPMSGIDALLSGSTSAQARLTVGTASSPWQDMTVVQCPGSGLTIDTSLQTIDACYLDPVDITLSGQLSEYGVLFARHVLNGSAVPISDPQFDGTQDPLDSSVIWTGILTGSDILPDHDWWAPLPLAPILGTVADYNAGNSGSLQLRVQTPDGRTSTWMPVPQLTTC